MAHEIKHDRLEHSAEDTLNRLGDVTNSLYLDPKFRVLELLEDVDEFYHSSAPRTFEHGRAGTYIEIDKPVVPIKEYGWIAPSSPAWKDLIDFTFNVSWPPPPPNAPNTVNLTTERQWILACTHASFASTNNSSRLEKVPFLHTACWLDELSDEEAIAWEKKTSDRLHWQGRTMGISIVWDIE
ncbi:hypothetical protein ARMGADRAFT_1089324 [Armillaria gallica]|uniref:Uncharacterized protein n=1 Tax=Armillaria gallica TaxID=47427 RepID=A0A2H3CK55_ARMGA|nr:hypothetical protein ARMGADRAFT_1089324 [Armillaria gallica]